MEGGVIHEHTIMEENKFSSKYYGDLLRKYTGAGAIMNEIYR